ncbi:MAG: substrate-binding domain-containing protein [Anaerolineae bacterium]|nr:substrate-binding domain-containing protein [Anaerolineae bacterium]
MKPVQRTFAIVALTTTLVSCGVRNSPATTPTLTATPPRVSATTATYPLMNDLLRAYGDGSAAYTLELYSANHQTRLDDLQNNRTNYFSTHHLPVGSSLWAAPIAQDGIAIITHPQTDLQNITLDQLRQIYNGQSVLWSDVGGVGDDIIVFSREDGSSIRAELERMVMGNRRTTANARLAFSDEQMVQQVAETVGGIGYVSWGYLNTLADADVTVLSVNEIEPTLMTIYDHVYPLTNTIYMVGKSEPQDGTRLFIGWIQSSEGQSVVKRQFAPLYLPTLPQE